NLNQCIAQGLMMSIDPLALTKHLIACPSITPVDAGALDVVQNALNSLGFTCTRMVFSQENHDSVDNLYARLGTKSPNLCFAGHVDVVPPGDLDAWDFDPFTPSEHDGKLYGRGVADMKGAIACWIAAVSKIKDTIDGSISLLITGDEEGLAVNGTRKMLPALGQGEIDACITGEPTNPSFIGEEIKPGRRGSLNAIITAHGIQGHTGYPHKADNAAHRIVRMLQSLIDWQIDTGNAYFEPSCLSVTNIHIDNQITNIVPGNASARLNIRFNDMHQGKDLVEDIKMRLLAACDQNAKAFTLETRISGESFFTKSGPLRDAIARACEEETGITPKLTTAGGTSDSRFIKDYCPVIDFGLCNPTIHQVNEHVAIDDLAVLTRIYKGAIGNYFAHNAG
ncbi:MAG: succinyl-diaminopimelate desuccinylase, partial [Pseudomonadota bacterium]